MIDTLYYLTAPRGIDTCLNCTEDECWQDTHKGDCPIWLKSPKSKDISRSRANQALKVIEKVCISGPISTPDLARILMDKGFYRNMVYYLIENDRLETERVKMHKRSRYEHKILVKGIS